MHFTRSRQGHLAGIFGIVALFGAGCGGGNKGGTYVDLQWSVADLGDPNKALYCTDVGAGDVVLDLQGPVSDSYTFHCSSPNYEGVTATLPIGTYSITVTLYGDPAIYGDATTVLDSMQSSLTLVSGPNIVPADFLVNSFVLGWVVTEGGLTSSCQAVGGSYIALDVYYSGQTQATTYYLNCSGYNPAATLSIPMGPYNVQWQAFVVDANHYDLSPGTTMASYTVQTGVQADLGTVYFAF
jgi:hypothetical protein